jgi:hypothetical protein
MPANTTGRPSAAVFRTGHGGYKVRKEEVAYPQVERQLHIIHNHRLCAEQGGRSAGEGSRHVEVGGGGWREERGEGERGEWTEWDTYERGAEQSGMDSLWRLRRGLDIV